MERLFIILVLTSLVGASPGANILSLNAAPEGTGAWVALGLDEPPPAGAFDDTGLDASDGVWRRELPGLDLDGALTVGGRWPLRGVLLEPGPDGALLTVELDGEDWNTVVHYSTDPPQLRFLFSPTEPAAIPSGDDVRLRLIVLDPGHGGPRWTGAGGPKTGVFEKELVLDITERVRDILETELEAEVVLTRRGDYPVGLRERVRTANELGADLFLSIHLNGGPAERRGTEMYYAEHYRPESPWSAEGGKRFGLPLEGELPFPVRLEAAYLMTRLTFEELNVNSRNLARSIMEAHTAGLGLPDRGVLPAPFYVLVEARMPAVLTESCYLSNPDQEALLIDPAYRQRVARAIAGGALDWARGYEAGLGL